MVQNTRPESAEVDAPKPQVVHSPAESITEQTIVPLSPTALPSTSTTAAWIEKIELPIQQQQQQQQQPHFNSTSSNMTTRIQPRAVQEMEDSPSPEKKQKQKEEHDGPDAKSQKYDRQLRLWGGNGQAALESAHVCLLNNGCGTVGVETLKNLVLPGIGQFTIIDNKLTTEEDLGVNFFLEESHLDKPRGECLRNMLCELNPDVTGHWLQALEDMSHYDIFIWTTPSMDIKTRNRIEAYCHDMQKPLITINSQGFYAYFHVQFSQDFPIVETHPEETAIRDFRILDPWTELAEWAASLTQDLEKQSHHKHGHVPWLALMLYYVNMWKDQHKTENGKPGEFRGTFKQQKELMKLIQVGQRYDNGEGGEENYDQAHANVMKTVRQPTLSSKVKEIFELCDQESYRHNGQTFWHLARALKSFHKKNQRLPLGGVVPDMKAESEVYVQLQNLYKAQARKDIDELKAFVHPSVLSRPGIEEEIATFCKNAETLHIIRNSFVRHDSAEERKVHTEWARAGYAEEENEIAAYKSASAEDAALEFATAEKAELEAEEEAEPRPQPEDMKPPLEYILLALRSMETWDVKDMADLNPDTVISAIEDLLSEPTAYVRGYYAMRLGESGVMKRVVRELERARGGELHNTASLVGGLVSQEVIKVITKQYVPVENLVVWDGVYCRMGTFRL